MVVVVVVVVEVMRGVSMSQCNLRHHRELSFSALVRRDCRELQEQVVCRLEHGLLYAFMSDFICSTSFLVVVELHEPTTGGPFQMRQWLCPPHDRAT